jgi:DNA-directed RNA polymerase alpha subunit
VKRSVEAIKDNISKFSIEELRRLKLVVLEEISKRDSQKENSSIAGRFYTMLYNRWCDSWDCSYIDDESRLKELAKYTEEEFLNFHSVGKAMVKFAKQELKKYNLSFLNS